MSPVTCHLSPVTCHLSPVTYQLSTGICHLSHITCNLSFVIYHLSPVTCHLSPDYYSLQLYLISKSNGTCQNKTNKKTYLSYLRNTLFDQKSPFHSVKKLHGGNKETHRQTDMATCRLNRPRCQINENLFGLKMKMNRCIYQHTFEGAEWLPLAGFPPNFQQYNQMSPVFFP